MHWHAAGDAVGYKKNNFLAPYIWHPKFFAPNTIPGMPWIYPENLEAIVAAISKLYANKYTDRHTNRIFTLDYRLQELQRYVMQI